MMSHFECRLNRRTAAFFRKTFPKARDDWRVDWIYVVQIAESCPVMCFYVLTHLGPMDNKMNLLCRCCDTIARNQSTAE